MYINIPVDDAINSTKEEVSEFNNVIPNAEFGIELLHVILKNSLMIFTGDYFQQFFGVIMGNILGAGPIFEDLEREFCCFASQCEGQKSKLRGTPKLKRKHSYFTSY